MIREGVNLFTTFDTPEPAREVTGKSGKTGRKSGFGGLPHGAGYKEQSYTFAYCKIYAKSLVLNRFDELLLKIICSVVFASGF
jgi:hypothetical protein